MSLIKVNTIQNANGTTGITFAANGQMTLANTPLQLTGGQIKFPSTNIPSADANTLDDYEEGTFTPTLSGFSGTGITTDANYTKIGRVVYCSVTIFPSSGNMTASSMTITQPFAGSSYGTGTWMGGGASQTGGIQAVPFGNVASLSGSLSATPLMNLGWFIFT